MAFRSAVCVVLFTLVLVFFTGGCSREPKTPVAPPVTPSPTSTEPEKRPEPKQIAKGPDPKLADPKEEPVKKEPIKKIEDPKQVDPKVPDADPVQKKPDPNGKDPQDPKKSGKKTPEPPAFVVPSEVLGKTYEQWKKQIKSPDPTRREEAMKQILAFGPDKAYEALPDIIGELKKHRNPSPVDLSVCLNGAYVMSQIFLTTKEPNPKLVDEALAIYKKFMKDPQVVLKTRAVQTVLSLGPKSLEAFEDVLKVAQDPSSYEIRREGLMVLGKMALDMKEMNPKLPAELRKAVDDSNVQVRLLGLQSTASLKGRFDSKELKAMVDKIETNIGPKGKEKDSPVMQIYGYSTLMTITGETAGYIEPVVLFLTNKDDAIKVQALNAIAALELKGQIALDPVLKIAHTAPTWQLRKEGLLTVMAISYDKDKKTIQPKVVTELLSAFGDKASELRLFALQAMMTVKPALSEQEVKNTIASLEIRAKREEEPLVKIWAYATLVTLAGKITPAHMEPILNMLEHKDAAVRRQALQVISLGGKDAKTLALDGVLKAVKDADTTVACAAIDALPHLEATETIPMLKTMAGDTKAHPDVIEAAGEAVSVLEEIAVLQKTPKKDDKK